MEKSAKKGSELAEKSNRTAKNMLNNIEVAAIGIEADIPVGEYLI